MTCRDSSAASASRFAAATLATVAALALAGCDSDETAPVDEHNPDAVEVYVAGTEVLAPYDVALTAGQTQRIEIKFFEDGEDLADIETDHFAGLTFSAPGLATVARVPGHNFQLDVTGGTAGTGTYTVGFGHGEDADERSFGPYSVTVTLAQQAVTIAFAARVGDEPFSCASSYANIGTTASTIAPKDFRTYVHDVRLIGAGGAEVPVTLGQDVWQLEGIAFLDFEDGTGNCSNGSAETHTAITGTVPAGSYSGLRFNLGIPFARNHGDLAAAPSPLNLSALWWGWQIGHIFTKIDFNSTGQPQGFSVHLGSTGCISSSPTSAPDAECGQPNRAEISLPGFTLGQVVVADLRLLLEDADVDVNTAETAPGCMSFSGDPECPALFANLNLPWEGTPSPGQKFFRVSAD